MHFCFHRTHHQTDRILISKHKVGRLVHRRTACRLFPPNSTRIHARASAFVSHPHSPVKVVKVNWGIRLTSTDSDPSLKAWLGHAMRSQVAPSRFTPIPCSHTSGDSSSSFRVLRSAYRTNLLSSCSAPSLTVRPSPWAGLRRPLPPFAVVELPEFRFIVYPHNQWVLLLESHPATASDISNTQLWPPRHPHEETEIPSSHITARLVE